MLVFVTANAQFEVFGTLSSPSNALWIMATGNSMPRVIFHAGGQLSSMLSNVNSFVAVTGGHIQVAFQCGSRLLADLRLNAAAVFNHSSACTLTLPTQSRLSIEYPAQMALGMHSGLNAMGSLVLGTPGNAVVLILPSSSFLNVSGPFSTDLNSQSLTQVMGTGTLYFWKGSSIALSSRFCMEFLQAGKLVWSVGSSWTFPADDSLLYGVGKPCTNIHLLFVA